ncbi:MAG: hypothetical protein HYV62_09860 [Candidatus Rokubacteria bacterium]|nr:hypothetical protein [Candidatus Rokubacteria bacterium]
MMRWSTIGLGLVVLLIVAGCASTPDTAPGPGGITLREDDDLDGDVWLAGGFNFTGYDTLYIAATQADAPKLNPDGVESLEWAKGVVREKLASELRKSGFFRAVVTSESEIRPGSRTLRLQNTIIDYAKGGAAARFFAGLYGAGQPLIKVRGQMLDGDTQVFVFEAKRRGESGAARWVGGYLSSRDIQEEDIEDLAEDLVDFIEKTSKK